jgi:hypothetical protein
MVIYCAGGGKGKEDFVWGEMTGIVVKGEEGKLEIFWGIGHVDNMDG